MEYTRLGGSGLKISKVILGAMSYGSPEWQEWVLDEEKSLPLLKHAYDVGLNTWDTADVYSNGRSEEIIGKAIQKYDIPRQKLVILSKCYFGVAQDGSQPRIAAVSKNDGEMVNRVGLSRKHIFDAVDGSVKRLGTYIDVLQIHRLDRDTPKKEIMKALNDVVDSGKVRYIGASSMAAWEFQMLQNIAETNGWHKFISMQNYHNLVYREEEREMIRSTKREESDNMLKNMIRGSETEIDKAIVDRLEEVAKRKGVGMAQIAIAWSIKQPGVNPIVGLGSKERIDQAVEAVKIELSDEDAKYLEEPYMPKQIQGH
ncbi:1-deoxyxylulose-5-phosphate synthase, partial [Lecanoromycetidae sp. Uapishka_2]